MWHPNGDYVRQYCFKISAVDMDMDVRVCQIIRFSLCVQIPGRRTSLAQEILLLLGQNTVCVTEFFALVQGFHFLALSGPMAV